MEGALTCSLDSCEHYVLDKKTKVMFGTVHHLMSLLNVVHMDVLGPTKTAWLGGHKYFISIVDDYSRHYWVYFMRQLVKVLELLVVCQKKSNV